MGCKALNNLVGLINLELYFKHELDELKGSFEQDELKEDQFNCFLSCISLKCDHITLFKYLSCVMIAYLFSAYENLKNSRHLNSKI